MDNETVFSSSKVFSRKKMFNEHGLFILIFLRAVKIKTTASKNVNKNIFEWCVQTSSNH